MSDSMITVRGWLGADVTLRRAGDVPVASFRLACTPRRFNRRTETWSDGLTQWYTVTAWRGLAENCAASLRRGDPVVVHGRLETRTYVNVTYAVDGTWGIAGRAYTNDELGTAIAASFREGSTHAA